MRQRLIHIIGELATGRNLIIVMIIWLCYAVFVMGIAVRPSPETILPIDLTFAESPTIICAMIEAYGEETRQDYLWSEVTWDVFYPVIYGLMLLLGLSYGMRNAGLNFSPMSALYFLPLLVVGADYFENISIVTLLWTYPSCSMEVATLASIFVTLKWVIFTICFLLLVVLYSIVLVRKISRQI